MVIQRQYWSKNWVKLRRCCRSDRIRWGHSLQTLTLSVTITLDDIFCGECNCLYKSRLPYIRPAKRNWYSKKILQLCSFLSFSLFFSSSSSSSSSSSKRDGGWYKGGEKEEIEFAILSQMTCRRTLKSPQKKKKKKLQDVCLLQKKHGSFWPPSAVYFLLGDIPDEQLFNPVTPIAKKSHFKH